MNQRSPMLLVAVLVAAVVGCASAPKPWYHGRALPRNYYAATRPDSECVEVRKRASVRAENDTVGLQRGGVGRLVILPVPVPEAVRGKLITMRARADENGDVMKDSIWVEGIGDHPYVTSVRRSVAGYKLWPAVMEGCRVSQRFVVRARG